MNDRAMKNVTSFDLEMGADDLPLPLEVELDHVPAEDEEQDQAEEEDDDLERGEEDVGQPGRRELLGFPDEELDGEEQDDEEDDDRPDDAGPFFLGSAIGRSPPYPAPVPSCRWKVAHVLRR